MNAENSINNNNNNNNNNHRRRKVKYFIKGMAAEIANVKAQLIAETTKLKKTQRVSTEVTMKMTTDDGPINNNCDSYGCQNSESATNSSKTDDETD